MMPRVSVALCTFNGGRFIADQLESILAQEDVLEVIVSDDGSMDDTLAQVRAVADRLEGGPQIRLIDGPRSGVAANFEHAVRACRGEFVALSDQDDVWLPDRLAAQLAQLERTRGAALLFADAELIDAAGHPLGATLFERLEVGPELLADVASPLGFDRLLRRNIVTGATVLFRRELLDQALPFPREWVHDEWLAIVAAATAGVTVLNRPVTAYRQHGANEIGVAEPTIGHKIRRVLQPRGDRNRSLAARSAVLTRRLEALGVGGDTLAAARAKQAFERFRAHLPANRFRRIVPVLTRAASGEYGRYASQGRMDVVRDLLQPVG
jgi:glycosyltransferase involved in cell wall biosynthesis